MRVLKVKDWLDRIEIQLDKDNIAEWKSIYDQIMMPLSGMEKYSDCLTDAQWLEDWEGATPQEAADEELSCWED